MSPETIQLVISVNPTSPRQDYYKVLMPARMNYICICSIITCGLLIMALMRTLPPTDYDEE
jgi:hypothetical protein